MTLQSTELLLTVQHYAQIFAFAFLLASGIKLFRSTGRRPAAVFALGMGIVLLSFLAMGVAYSGPQSKFSSDGGWDPTFIQSDLVWLSVILNAAGLLIGAAGLALYCFRSVRNAV